MSVLSVDLAYRDCASIGICSLEAQCGVIAATPIRLSDLGQRGPPTVRGLAETLAALGRRLGARLMLIDGPQAWKCADNGLAHARVCERVLATPGKTGLPESTKPATYGPFTRFSIALFDTLAVLGWPRLPSPEAPHAGACFAVESFPTAAWRALGLKPLPSKARTPAEVIPERLAALRSRWPIAAPNDLSHDELQALVSGLAGLALEAKADLAYRLVGLAPRLYDGTWREGYILIPTAQRGGRSPMRAGRL